MNISNNVPVPIHIFKKICIKKQQQQKTRNCFLKRTDKVTSYLLRSQTEVQRFSNALKNMSLSMQCLGI